MADMTDKKLPYKDIPINPNIEIPELDPDLIPHDAPVEAQVRTKHHTDLKFEQYVAALAALYINVLDQVELDKARAHWKTFAGHVEILRALELIKDISQNHHMASIDAVERNCFHRSNPGSYKTGRWIGRKVAKAAGEVGLRVVHTCAVYGDEVDRTWLAVCWNGIIPEWRFDEVEAK